MSAVSQRAKQAGQSCGLLKIYALVKPLTTRETHGIDGLYPVLKKTYVSRRLLLPKKLLS